MYGMPTGSQVRVPWQILNNMHERKGILVHQESLYRWRRGRKQQKRLQGYVVIACAENLIYQSAMEASETESRFCSGVTGEPYRGEARDLGVEG